MTSAHRPPMGDRTMSTPLSVNVLLSVPSHGGVAPPSRLGSNVFTPPASPRHSRSSSDLSTKTDDSSPNDGVLSRQQGQQKSSLSNTISALRQYTLDGSLICPYEVEILKDHHDRNQMFGQGAWSMVFRGTCHQKPTSGLMTPPMSPVTRPPLLVAIKEPARKDAKTILQNEAKILSYLMAEEGNEDHIVPFYGVLINSSSLVLAAVPLSLEEHIRKSAVSAQALRSTWNMTEPVIGNTTTWLTLAYKLITALSWLHENAMVVHGDIKPGNILLEKHTRGEDVETLEDKSHFEYEPLFADFSSSQRIDTSPTPNTLSALTREYTAPELLSSKVLLNPNSTATRASDVFSLAVTLLVAATGNTMVYSGGVYQRQAMATQGWMVIQAVRNGPMEEGARVPRQGVVERTLDKAVLRDGMGRIDAASWKSKVGDMMKGEPSKS